MPQQDLTTLAAVKLIANAQIPNGPAASTSDDPLLSSLITAISQVVLTNLSRRTVLSSPRTDTFDGQGWTWRNQRWPLRYQPVSSVQSVYVNGSLVPPIAQSQPLNPNNSGWTLDPYIAGEIPGRLQFLKLNGYGFTPNWAPNNCVINYTAGYQNSEVPNATTFTPASPYGLLLADAGVVYAASGTALTSTATNPPPAGSYVPPNPLAASSPTSNYVFNAADISAGIIATYSYCPSAIEIATRMWVIEMYKYRSRIGERSQSQGGLQTASYIVKDMPDFVALALSPFKMTNFVT